MICLPETGPEVGRCVCGAAIREDSFRDETSEQEWTLSGLCQTCQDRIFFAVGPEGNTPRHPVRIGALASHRCSGRQVLEVAVLPFLCIPSLHVLAWEARFTLRIGAVLPLALPSELQPMSRMLDGYRVHVTEVYSFENPRLARWFADLDLLVGLDRMSVDSIVAACPSLGCGLRLALADVLPWNEMAGQALTPFSNFVRTAGLDPVRTKEWPPPSSLRRCARMGAALGFEDPSSPEEKRTVLWHLLDALKPHFRNQPRG